MWWRSHRTGKDAPPREQLPQGYVETDATTYVLCIDLSVECYKRQPPERLGYAVPAWGHEASKAGLLDDFDVGEVLADVVRYRVSVAAIATTREVIAIYNMGGRAAATDYLASALRAKWGQWPA